jgi:hypothetical protein
MGGLLTSQKIKDNEKENDIKIFIRNVSESEIDVIIMVFENKSVGGGKIKSHKYVNDLKILIIDYENEECIEKAVNRGPVKVNDREFMAEIYKSDYDLQKSNFSIESTNTSQSNVFNFKLTIHKMNSNDKLENVGEKLILLYIEYLLKHNNFKFFKVTYGLDEIHKSTCEYIMVSNESLDFNLITNEYQKKPKLIGRTITIEQLKDNGSIIVFTNEHADLVEIHFGNPRVSGGGNIKKFKKFHDFFLIEFEDKNCAERVLSRSKETVEKMKVERFYEDINDFEFKYETDVKAAYELTSYEIEKSEFPFSFIFKNRLEIEKFKEYLEKNKIELIDNNERFKMKYNSKIFTDRGLDECIQEFKSKYMKHELNVEAEVLLKLRPKLDSLYTNQNIYLKLSFNEINGKIQLEGLADIVKGEITKIECIINDSQNKKIEDKVLYLKTSFQCKLLEKIGFIASLKQEHPDLTVKIDPLNSTVTFNGFLQSVNSSKQKMFNLLKSIVHKESEVSCLLGKFLGQSRVYFDKQGFKCEFEVSDENELQMNNEKELMNGKCKLNLYAFEESELNKANEFILKNLILLKHELDAESIDLLDNLYPQFLEKIRDDFRLTLEQDHVVFGSSKASRKVWCIGKVLLATNLFQKILDFFEANTILKKYCDSFSSEDLKYLYIVKSKEIQNICSSLNKETNFLIIYNFEIKNNSEIRLEITGTKKTVERFNLELRNTLTKKIVNIIELNDEGVKDLFLNERGRRTLNNIENQSQCLIIPTNQK